MKIQHPKKLVTLAVAGLVLAAILMLQAASGVTARHAPELAVRLMPNNGEAVDRVAFATFVTNATDPSDTAAAARAASLAVPTARDALKFEPLLSRSLSIVALAQTDIAQQARFLTLTDKINRRDLSLQGVKLGNQAVAQDYEGIFETVDRILRVGPEHSDQIFPLLLEALQEERGVNRLLDLANSGSPWINEFLLYSLQNGDVLSELSDFRRRTSSEHPTLDRLLIASLIRSGSYGQARELYQQLIAKDGEGEEVGANPLGWQFRFPPFGWSLADRSGFRAQPARDGQSIDINVGAGQDGTLAERVVPAPDGKFEIAIEHNLELGEQLEHLRVLLHCGEVSSPFFEGRLNQNINRFSIAQSPAACDYVHVVINARVFSNRRPLRGAIISASLVETDR